MAPTDRHPVDWTLPVASLVVVVLVVAGLFALAPPASADKIVFTRVDRGGGGWW
jgi:hypothetical protein